MVFSCFDIQNHALKVSFDIENLIFGNIPSAKKKVFDHNTCNVKNSDSPDIEIRISKQHFDNQNRALKVSFDNENLIFGKCEHQNGILIFKIVHKERLT